MVIPCHEVIAFQGGVGSMFLGMQYLTKPENMKTQDVYLLIRVLRFNTASRLLHLYSGVHGCVAACTCKANAGFKVLVNYSVVV